MVRSAEHYFFSKSTFSKDELEDLVLEQMTADPDTPFIPINKPPFILFRSESWLITIWTWIIFLLIV